MAKHSRLEAAACFVKLPQMDIRLARQTDADALVAFNEAMAMETEGKKLDATTLKAGVVAVFADAGKGFYVVAEEAGKIVGALMVTSEWSDWRNAWFWWIQSVYVIPEYRGRMIYNELYEFVKESAEQTGDVCGFRLYVEKENKKAQKVYEKSGMDASHYLMYESKN